MMRAPRALLCAAVLAAAGCGGPSGSTGQQLRFTPSASTTDSASASAAPVLGATFSPSLATASFDVTTYGQSDPCASVPGIGVLPGAVSVPCFQEWEIVHAATIPGQGLASNQPPAPAFPRVITIGHNVASADAANWGRAFVRTQLFDDFAEATGQYAMLRRLNASQAPGEVDAAVQKGGRVQIPACDVPVALEAVALSQTAQTYLSAKYPAGAIPTSAIVATFGPCVHALTVVYPDGTTGPLAGTTGNGTSTRELVAGVMQTITPYGAVWQVYQVSPCTAAELAAECRN